MVLFLIPQDVTDGRGVLRSVQCYLRAQRSTKEYYRYPGKWSDTENSIVSPVIR